MTGIRFSVQSPLRAHSISIPSEPGTFEVSVTATDADNDRPNDALSSEQDFTISVVDTSLQNVFYPTTSGDTRDELGRSIAMHGDLILVGASRDDISGTSTAGAAYLV